MFRPERLTKFISFVKQRCSLIQVRYRRRTMVPPPWIPPTYKSIYNELSAEERELAEKLISESRNYKPVRSSSLEFSESPTLTKTNDAQYSFESSKRIGLIGRKIGMTLQWQNDGTRLLCTMIYIPENHVVGCVDPENWFRHSIVGKRKAFGKMGAFYSQMVGAINHSSIFYTDRYRRIFERVKVPCKKKLANFLVSEDAIVQPGTRLDVQHFTVGQFITISGKTIDWGFQGAMHRWGFKGQPRLGTTKSHRRVGSIGSASDAKVWPGKRMPGHMGYEWRHAVGLEIIRINPLKQVLYIKGCVPGDVEETLLIKDCMIEEKRVKNPPFPTFYPPSGSHLIMNEEQKQYENAQHKNYTNDECAEIYNITMRDVYHPKLFKFSQTSIVFTEADETRSAVRDKTRAKTAKVKK